MEESVTYSDKNRLCKKGRESRLFSRSLAATEDL